MTMKWKAIAIAAMLVLMVALSASAEEKMNKDEACSLLGSCSGEMVDSAKAMQVECAKMMAKGEEMIEKGKMIRGQGMLWQDKEMEADGMALYEQGKKMYDEAKKMNDACALIIASAEKTKKKYSHSKKRSSGQKASEGDMVPQ
jgi:hypothetical protein